MSETRVETLVDILTGKCVGRYVCHITYQDGQPIVHNGLMERVFGRGTKKKYLVSYWVMDQATMEKVDEFEKEVGLYSLGADYIVKDLII